MLGESQELPKYRMNGGIELYQFYLPEFGGRNLTRVIDQLVAEHGTVRILDIGAGNFTFLRECVGNPAWQGKVQGTGVSADNFLTEAEQKELSKLKIKTYFITASRVPRVLNPEYDLAVSVLANIYDPGTDYVKVMWQILKDKGIGLLDQVAKVPPEKVASWQDLESRLRKEGYELELTIRPEEQELLPADYTHKPPPLAEPVPWEQRSIYIGEMERLEEEMAKPEVVPINPDQVVSIVFQKVAGLRNLGEIISKLKPT